MHRAASFRKHLAPVGVRPHNSGPARFRYSFAVEDFHLLHYAGSYRRYPPGTLPAGIDSVHFKYEGCATKHMVTLIRHKNPLIMHWHSPQLLMLKIVGLGPFLTGKQTWFQASIYSDRGAFDEAETLLKEVTAVFANIHKGDAALATIDLAEVQLKAGKSMAAYFSTQAILPLITPLGARSQLVSSAEHALRELASRGAEGMTEGFVNSLRRLVESIRRERHLWRSLLHVI